MTFPDRRTTNVLLTILLFAVALGLVYAARRVLVIFFFAILFAYVLEPVVKFLQRHSLLFRNRNLRGPAVVEAYLVFLILVVLFGHAVIPGLVRRTGKALDEVPLLLNGLATGETASEIGDKYGWSDAQKRRVGAFLAKHREKIQNLARDVDQSASNAPQTIGWLVVIPVLAIFFLLDGDHISKGMIHIASLGGKYKDVQDIADEINLVLKRYVRAKITLCGLSFVFYSAAMFVLRFPHAILLGFAGGVLEFVPVAGWMISAAAILITGGLTHCHWIVMAVLLGIWRLIQDYVTTPRVMGHQLEIHPLMVIFTVMVGWEIGGLVGIYALVPVVAGTRVIWRRFVIPGPQAQSAPALVHTAISDPVFEAGAPSLTAQTAASSESTG
jgi:predicted PurR-regulated permease PerM